MNIHELATVSQENLINFHVFILNNEGYASIRNSQLNHFHYKFGCDAESGLVLPDYSNLANMFGFEYFEINEVNKINSDFFSNFFTKKTRTLTNIRIKNIEMVGPKLKTLIQDGEPMTEDFGGLSW
jgi:thiamine pyrophosphate-dependent acetolactate synthase large subunit-like protein